MNYFAPLQGLFVGLLSLTAPLWVLLALPFTKWDKYQTTLYGMPTVRGELPNAKVSSGGAFPPSA